MDTVIHSESCESESDVSAVSLLESSEAGLEWIRFVIGFSTRSRRWEVTAHFRADFWVGVASRCET